MTKLINSVKIEEGFTIEFVANPKRLGFKAYKRYEEYMSAKTLAEYTEIAEKKFAAADLRYDESHGYLKIFDADGEQVNMPEAAAE